MAEKDRDWYWQNLNNPAQRGEHPPPRKRHLRRALKHLLQLALLVVLAAGAWTLWKNPVSQQWGEARWHALLGRLGLEHPAANATTQSTKYSDSPRSLAECIKPDNLIDDEVRDCVKGQRAKTW